MGVNQILTDHVLQLGGVLIHHCLHALFIKCDDSRAIFTHVITPLMNL